MVWPIIVLAVAAATAGQAQAPNYDPATFTRISGTIIDVREFGAPAVLQGIYVTLKTEKRSVEVYLCPAGFLRRFGLRFNRGELLQVGGSRVRYGGSDLMLAREIRRKNDILNLRDEDGAPYWEDQT